MIKRIACLVIITLSTLTLNGCMVAESKYLKKVDEADILTKSLAEQTEKYDKLIVENNKLKAETASLTKDKQTLTNDKNNLEQILKSKSDTLSQSITDLRQKNADLEAENKSLKASLDSLQKAKEEKVKEVSSIYEKLLQNMKSEISQGQVTISELKGKLTVNMEAAILFDSGKADIKPDGLVILLKMVNTLKTVSDKVIRIEGHTDNVPINTRTFPTNWELSAARAINVCKYLLAQGVDPSMVSAAAFAENKPVADNETRDGRAKNRRIEITLVNKD